MPVVSFDASAGTAALLVAQGHRGTHGARDALPMARLASRTESPSHNAPSLVTANLAHRTAALKPPIRLPLHGMKHPPGLWNVTSTHTRPHRQPWTLCPARAQPALVHPLTHTRSLSPPHPHPLSFTPSPTPPGWTATAPAPAPTTAWSALTLSAPSSSTPRTRLARRSCGRRCRRSRCAPARAAPKCAAWRTGGGCTTASCS